jgi:hypothetical protein
MQTSIHQAYVAKVVAKVQSALQGQFQTKQAFNADTLVELAKELKLVIGRRGRGGGWEPTDIGLQFIGENVEKFRAMEAMEAKSHEEQLKKDRAETRAARAKIFETSIANAAAISLPKH